MSRSGEPGHPRRNFLVQMLVQCRDGGATPKCWEISPVDEALLFEFIPPSTATRDRGFKLCNTAAKWDADVSALLLEDGRRRRFDLKYMIDFEFVPLDQIRAAMAKLPRTLTSEFDTWQSVWRRVLDDLVKPKVEAPKRPTSVDYPL